MIWHLFLKPIWNVIASLWHGSDRQRRKYYEARDAWVQERLAGMPEGPARDSYAWDLANSYDNTYGDWL